MTDEVAAEPSTRLDGLDNKVGILVNGPIDLKAYGFAAVTCPKGSSVRVFEPVIEGWRTSLLSLGQAKVEGLVDPTLLRVHLGQCVLPAVVLRALHDQITPELVVANAGGARMLLSKARLIYAGHFAAGRSTADNLLFVVDDIKFEED